MVLVFRFRRLGIQRVVVLRDFNLNGVGCRRSAYCDLSGFVLRVADFSATLTDKSEQVCE